MTFAENVSKPDNVWLRTLVVGSRWNSPGPGTEITVYIGDNESLTFDDGSEFSIDALTPNAFERSGINLALELFASVCNIKFTLTDNRDDAQIVFAIADDEDAQGALGYSYFPGDLLNLNTGEDQTVVVVNHEAYSNPPRSARQGGFDFITFTHELGHAVGLDHPHDGTPPFPGVNSPTGDYGLFDMNQGIYTMMTYNDGWNTGPDGVTPSANYGWEGTAMALDIAALQYLYGANKNFATGDDTYMLKNVNGPGTFYSCIWDAAGIDTIRQDADADCTIDLRAATLARDFGGGGFVSYVGGIFGGFTIANGAVIERAIGGGGDDSLLGNEAANTLLGRGGHDAMTAAAGGDTVRGGDGDDSITGGGGRDHLAGGDGDDSFVYRNLSSSNGAARDNIADFEQDHDHINLRWIDAVRGQAGNQSFTFLAAEGADFTGAGEVRFTHISGSRTLVEATNDGDATAELAIVLKGHIDLTALDFFL